MKDISNSVTYIFRSQKTKAFSIERQFDDIIESIGNTVIVRKIYLPDVSSGIVSMLRNMLYVRSHAKGLVHISGDVHYSALLYSGPVVLTVHDCDFLFRSTGLRFILFWLFWFQLPKIKYQKITVITEKTKNEVFKVPLWKTHQVFVIGNCVSKDFFQIKPLVGNASCRILHIGTRPNKNLERVIESLAGLGVKLIIVGPLSNKQKLMLDNFDIDYSNEEFVSHSKMLEMFSSVSIISFPSIYEGFGVPIIEGQAAGKIVITSKMSPMDWVAGNGALLVDPFDVTSIRNGFIRAIEYGPEIIDIVKKGRINVKRFTSDCVADSYIEIYKDIFKK